MAHQEQKEKGFLDSELVRRAQAGDNNALSQIITRYEEKVYNFALRFMQNREDAEDVLQETFLSVIKSIKTFQRKASLSTWIYKIATNAALMKLRSQKRKFESFDEDTVDLSRDYIAFNQRLADSPFEYVNNKQIAEKINGYLDELPPKHRSVFLLRDVENFSTNEIAQMLNMSIPAVKSNLRRARIALRDKLADHLGVN